MRAGGPVRTAGGSGDGARRGTRTKSSSSSGPGASRRDGGGIGAGGGAPRPRSHRTINCTSQSSAMRTRNPICSTAYPRALGAAGGCSVSAIDSRIDVSACTFFMR